MLGELEVDSGIVVSDLEAGVGTLIRMQPGVADVVLVVAEPTVRSIETARRAAGIAAERAAGVVVANRITSKADAERIRTGLPNYEIVEIPDDPAISQADKDGVAPLDASPDSPGVGAIVALSDRILEHRSPVG